MYFDNNGTTRQKLFYHAENRLFEPEKHKMLSKVYVNTPFEPFDFEKYKEEKKNYNKCADFTKLKSKDAAQCTKEKEEKVECLSNDIYVPYTHVLAMKDQFEQNAIESNKPDDSQDEQNVGFGGRKQTSSRKRKGTSSKKRTSRKRKGTSSRKRNNHRRNNVRKRNFC